MHPRAYTVSLSKHRRAKKGITSSRVIALQGQPAAGAAGTTPGAAPTKDKPPAKADVPVDPAAAAAQADVKVVAGGLAGKAKTTRLVPLLCDVSVCGFFFPSQHPQHPRCNAALHIVCKGWSWSRHAFKFGYLDCQVCQPKKYQSCIE